MKLLTEETQTVTITKKGAQIVTAGDIETPGQVEILNGDLHHLK